MPFRKLILLLPLLLAACLAQSKIQTRYDRDHHDCQSEAEHKIDKVLPPGSHVSQKDRNAELLTLFSDCMARKGWAVAKPKTAGTPTTDNSIPPEPSPAYAARPQPFQQSPQPEPNAQPQPAPGVNPGLISPSPMPPTGAATYQPTYGSGPGRQF